MDKLDTNRFIRRWFIVLTVVFKFTSTTIKSVIRSTYCYVDYSPVKEKFNKKFFNLIFISFSMSLTIPFSLISRKIQPKEIKINVPTHMKLLVPVISTLDLFNTFFSNLAAINKGMSLDSFELVLTIFLIILIQKIFMRKTMYGHMIIGIVALTCSIIVQIVSDILNSKELKVAMPNIVFLVIASVMKALHAILSEYVLQNSEVDPELFIGFVGLINLMIVLFIIYPIVFIIGEDLCRENLCTTFKELFSSKSLIFTYFVYSINCFFYDISLNRVLLYTGALLWSVYVILSDGIKGIIDIIGYLIPNFPLKGSYTDKELSLKFIFTSLNLFFIAIAILLFT